MKHSILKALGILGLLGTQACITPVGDTPWDFARISRAQPLALNETQVRAQYVSLNGGPGSGTQYVDAQYGVTSQLTLGVSEGESLRRISNASGFLGQENYSLTANYGLPGGSSKFNSSAQMQMLFKDRPPRKSGPAVEFRPSFAVYNDSFVGRVGLNLQDSFDPQFLLEGAYWSPIGEYFIGMLELDVALGDLDEYYITPGFVTQVRELVQLQISFPVGLNSDSSGWQSLVGLAIRF